MITHYRVDSGSTESRKPFQMLSALLFLPFVTRIQVLVFCHNYYLTFGMGCSLFFLTTDHQKTASMIILNILGGLFPSKLFDLM